MTDWMKKVRHHLPKNLGDVLEVGSLNVNGTIRDAFVKGEYESYIGIDMRVGKDVDVVINAHDLTTKFKADSFDLVLSVATIEHDDAFWLTQKEINTVLKKGGYYILCVPTITFHYHPYPHDYWRFTASAVVSVLFRGYEILDLEDISGALICCVGRKL
jgi:SAM-dependent methyltransferase